MKGTREFYQIQEQFEKDIKAVIYGHKIERVGKDEKVPSSVFYNDGYVNTLFQVYMLGHGNGKLTERVEV